MSRLSSIVSTLERAGREDLAVHLRGAVFQFRVSDVAGTEAVGTLRTTVEVYCPLVDLRPLRALAPRDRHAIVSAFVESYPPRSHDIEIRDVEFHLAGARFGG